MLAHTFLLQTQHPRSTHSLHVTRTSLRAGRAWQTQCVNPAARRNLRAWAPCPMAKPAPALAQSPLFGPAEWACRAWRASLGMYGPHSTLTCVVSTLAANASHLPLPGVGVHGRVCVCAWVCARLGAAPWSIAAGDDTPITTTQNSAQTSPLDEPRHPEQCRDDADAAALVAAPDAQPQRQYSAL